MTETTMRVLAVLVLAGVCLQALATERRPGVIKTSDRREYTGEVWFTDGKVRLYEGENAAGGRYVNIAQNEIVSISFFMREKSMEHPWRFKMAGSDEKEILAGEYPLINFGAKVKLASGKVLDGHFMTAPVYIRIPGPVNTMDYDNKKFVLKYQIKGEVGQKYEDIVYVESISFTGQADAGEGDNGMISGTLRGLGKLEQMAAFGCERQAGFQGKVDAAKDTYTLENLPKDVYDIAVLTDRGIYVGMSDATKTVKNARPLEKGDEQALAKTLAKYVDFFDNQELLALKGHREAAKTLVHQFRVKEQHAEEGLKGQQLHRLDIWCWHLRTTEWMSEKQGRAQLFRYFEPKEGQKRPIKILAEFGAIKVEPAVKKNVEVNYEVK